jgi:hypothetical protein
MVYTPETTNSGTNLWANSQFYFDPNTGNLSATNNPFGGTNVPWVMDPETRRETYRGYTDKTAYDKAYADAVKNYGLTGSNVSTGKGGTGRGKSAPRNQTNVSYSKKVYTEDEFRTIGNAISQNLLGRLLSDSEVKKALAAANAESVKNPNKTVTKTHYNSSGTSTTSSSTTSGGFDAQASLEKKIGGTVESQAYTTNNVFNDAMRILASRIG